MNKSRPTVIDCNKYSVSNLLEKLVGLSHLELANGPIDNNTYENIIKLTSLTVLKINEMTEVTDSYIWGIGKKLKLLTEFHIETDEIIPRFAINAFVREAKKKNIIG